MKSLGKVSITPAAPIFQWWDFIPYYSLKDCWSKKPLELNLSEVRALYSRGAVFLLDCQHDEQRYLVYLAQIPEELGELPVKNLGPFEAIKLIRQFPSKWKRIFPRFLGLIFVAIVLLKMFFSFRQS